MAAAPIIQALAMQQTLSKFKVGMKMFKDLINLEILSAFGEQAQQLLGFIAQPALSRLTAKILKDTTESRLQLIYQLLTLANNPVVATGADTVAHALNGFYEDMAMLAIAVPLLEAKLRPVTSLINDLTFKVNGAANRFDKIQQLLETLLGTTDEPNHGVIYNNGVWTITFTVDPSTLFPPDPNIIPTNPTPDIGITDPTNPDVDPIFNDPNVTLRRRA